MALVRLGYFNSVIVAYIRRLSKHDLVHPTELRVHALLRVHPETPLHRLMRPAQVVHLQRVDSKVRLVFTVAVRSGTGRYPRIHQLSHWTHPLVSSGTCSLRIQTHRARYSSSPSLSRHSGLGCVLTNSAGGPHDHFRAVGFRHFPVDSRS